MATLTEGTTAPITRVQIARYAGAVGDFNPIHLDDAFAAKAGLPSVIAHGPLTLALILDVLVAQLGSTAIRSFDARLRAPVFPGDALTVVPVDGGVDVRNAAGTVVATVTLTTLDLAIGDGVMAEYEYLLEEDRDAGVRILTLNRPDNLNSWNAGMRREMRDAIDRAAAEPSLRCLVLTGAGRAFSAGEDVSGMADLSAIGTRGFRAAARGIHDVFDTIEAMEVPVIAAVDGVAAGGGFELALLSCDFRVMSSRARFVMPEAKVGLIPGSGGCSRLVRYIGLGRAKELVLLGGSVDATRGLELGLATVTCAEGEAVNEALVLAERIGASAPLAVGMAKLILNTCTDVDAETGRRLERLGQSVLKMTEDHSEGVRAFGEKRKPEWRGR